MTTDLGPRTTTGLVLLDFQIDFLADDGRMPVARNHVTPVLQATRAAIGVARREGRPIIKIGNEFRPSDRLMNALRRHAAISGTPGADWDPRFDTDEAFYVPKWKADAFCNPALDQLLAELHIGCVAIAGLQARACVTATSKSALARHLDVRLLTDAIACRSDATRDAAFRRLARRGAHLVSAGSTALGSSAST